MSLTSAGVRRLVLDRTVTLILVEARKGDKEVSPVARALEVAMAQMGPLAKRAEADVAEALPKWREVMAATMTREVVMDATDDEVADNLFTDIERRRKALEAGHPPTIRST